MVSSISSQCGKARGTVSLYLAGWMLNEPKREDSFRSARTDRALHVFAPVRTDLSIRMGQMRAEMSIPSSTAGSVAVDAAVVSSSRGLFFDSAESLALSAPASAASSTGMGIAMVGNAGA